MLARLYGYVFKTAMGRLAVRSVLVGVALAADQLADSDYSVAALKAALVAGGWAALEAFTPLNALVGFFRR